MENPTFRLSFKHWVKSNYKIKRFPLTLLSFDLTVDLDVPQFLQRACRMVRLSKECTDLRTNQRKDPNILTDCGMFKNIAKQSKGIGYMLTVAEQGY